MKITGPLSQICGTVPFSALPAGATFIASPIERNPAVCVRLPADHPTAVYLHNGLGVSFCSTANVIPVEVEATWRFKTEEK